ncbi:hypothetical protein ACH4UR_01500 [Streptomyces lydicus]|uniref:hypothetical protein n=1 Tax=Streptomyces lydicus TaxID=47763 RepID=UPI0033CD3D30
MAIVGAAAGMLGAAVGAAGAIVSAVVTGRSQERSQHSHWRRQVRRDAYTTLIKAAHELYRELTPRTLSLAHNGVRYPAYAPNELVAALVEACYTVQLEGPADVSMQADVVRDIFTRWNGAIFWQEASGDLALTHPELEALANIDLLVARDLAGDAQEKFLTMARKALDATSVRES